MSASCGPEPAPDHGPHESATPDPAPRPAAKSGQPFIDQAARLRELADAAWGQGHYRAGASLDRAADLCEAADQLAAQARAHHAASIARLDQLEAAIRDGNIPGA